MPGMAVSEYVRFNLGDEVEERPHSVLEEKLVGVVERDAGREVALHGAALQPRSGPNSTLT